MKKLESIINKGKVLFLAGVASLTIGCASLNHYIEPRVGLIIPTTTEQTATPPPSFSVGASYGFSIGKSGFGFEVGSNYFRSGDDYIETNSLLSELNMHYSPFRTNAKPYLIGGVSLLNEFSAIDIPKFDVHERVSNATFGIDFGVGVTIFDRLNIRAGYTFLPTSENVKDMITMVGGYRFLFGNKKYKKR